MLSDNILPFMYCHGLGQHRNHKEHIYEYSICLTLPRKVCNVIVNKQWVTSIDPRLTPQKRNTFECESLLLFPFFVVLNNGADDISDIKIFIIIMNRHNI